jgi:hypothetical protein
VEFAGVFNFVTAGLTLATLALRERSPADESSTPTPGLQHLPTYNSDLLGFALWLFRHETENPQFKES